MHHTFHADRHSALLRSGDERLKMPRLSRLDLETSIISGAAAPLPKGKLPDGKAPLADAPHDWQSPPMKIVNLDASAWQTPEDFYAALLPRLGAPDLHGRSLNALNDSLYGGINKLEPPYRVVVGGTTDLRPDLKAFLAQVTKVFFWARTQHGADIEIELV